MLEIKKYFEENKEDILKFIKEEQHIFPKLFIESVEDLHDTDFYKNIKNNIFKYYFTIDNIKIFNIRRIKEKFFFKSDIKYKSVYLFFTNNNVIYLNDKKIKNENYLSINSEDEIYIENSDFLIISYLEKDIFSFEDLLIKINEKNLFNEFKINKFKIKNIFLKDFSYDENVLKNI